MAPTRFLFWNINGKPLEAAVVRLAEEHDIDVVVLAESEITLAQPFRLAPGVRSAVQIHTRNLNDAIVPRYDHPHYSLARLHVPGKEKVLLACVHLPSKLHSKDASQAVECEELRNVILREEEKAGHQRTIVLGDFNMNPFEDGMVKTTGLHAVMSRGDAQRGSRVVQGRKYSFFYNPMWNRMGDAHLTAGSYYHHASEHIAYFWNLFDQVLIRPDLIAGFDLNELRIVTKIREESLVTGSGRPDSSNFSDHLPIVFALEFKEEKAWLR